MQCLYVKNLKHKGADMSAFRQILFSFRNFLSGRELAEREEENIRLITNRYKDSISDIKLIDYLTSKF